MSGARDPGSESEAAAITPPPAVAPRGREVGTHVGPEAALSAHTEQALRWKGHTG